MTGRVVPRYHVARLHVPAVRERRRGTRRLATGLTVGIVALVLAGCASGSSSSSSAEGAAAVSAAPTPADGGASATTGRGLGAPLDGAVGRSVVVTADESVRVDDVLTATARLTAVATAHNATVASQTVSTGLPGPTPDPGPATPDGAPACPSTGCPTSYASSTTTLRVDPAQVDALLADVGRLGTVEASTRSSTDVTADVADVAARVANAQASLARVRALMARATSIGDVVMLESELSRREGDLEALEARQRALADQTAQATVTVRLTSAAAPAPASDAGTGFVAGLRAGWDSVTGVLSGLLTVVGALVPWLVVLAPAGLVTWAVVRRRRRPTAEPVA